MGRIPILDVMPTVECGALAAHATVNQTLPVSATVFREGHDAVGANVIFRPRDSVPTRAAAAKSSRSAAAKAVRPLMVRLEPGAPGTDSFHATVTPTSVGWWTVQIEAWSDPLATWRHAVEAKMAAGQDADQLANDLATGAQLLRRVARRTGQRGAAQIRTAATALANTKLSVAKRVAPALSASVWRILHADPLRELVTKSAATDVWVDRELAEFGSWYEFFPRSIGAQIQSDGTPVKHGTLATARSELTRVAAMGFDVVYLPPIHPIGEVGRKGRNNTLTPTAEDVGSPWAIGSRFGGHDAIHPKLGTLDDFARFVQRATELGLQVALDLALQCAPDHPWVEQHPEWFTTLPDGTIAYAENPPKKYQDIYPLNFDNDYAGLSAEVLRIVRLWIERGVTIFRVDNPHTKPVNFWEWLIAEVRKDHPDVIFLAEAFTRPAMMHTLGKVGFTQSYTYFTWRTGKGELTDYVRELVGAAHYMRPNFFVNTPDILHASLVHGGQAMFAIRAVLAATLSPSWGVYSGYELYESTPVRPGSEEYLDSEKYQLRPRDFATPLEQGQSLQPFLTQLNRIRRKHPALQQLRGTVFHGIDNENLLCYSRRSAGGDTLLVVVCLASHGEQWGRLDVDMPALGLPWGTSFTVLDEVSGEHYTLDQHATIRLDPTAQVAHIFHVEGI